MNNNSESSQTLKLSVQDRLRMGKNAHRFRSVVCLGTSPRAVGSGSEVFVDGEDVYGLHDEYLPNKNTKNVEKRSRILGANLTEICVRGGNGREKDSVDLFRGDDVGK